MAFTRIKTLMQIKRIRLENIEQELFGSQKNNLFKNYKIGAMVPLLQKVLGLS